ncbi:MAG TPA: HAD family phosphatase [Candidatus Paceibacterota bacterium]
MSTKAKKQGLPAGRQVAIFDIDGTIFRSSVLIALTDELIARKIFPAQATKEFERDHTRWLDRQGDYERYIKSVVETYMRYIKGVEYSKLADVAESMALKHRDRTYRFTRELIVELKRKGYYLLAISQSPKTVLDFICRRYGFDKVYGRIYELGPQNKFTGNILDLHLIANKANVVKRAVEKENLTLKGSVAVGDTEDDVPMLELVERAIAFNPNQKLYKHAKRMGWEIVVERKDVIYKL